MEFFMKVVGNMNFLAVIVAGIAFWLLGAVWFSMIFGKTWGDELEKMGLKIKDNAQGGVAGKFIARLFLNSLLPSDAHF